LSLAFAETVTVPVTVAPLAGAVIDTVGGVVSGVLFTVMDTAVLVVLFPEVSVAIAVRLCWPFANVVVFNDCEYGAALTAAPRFVPSTWNCTLATPTLSLAFAETVTVPVTVAPLAGAVIDTVGGVVSGVLFTVMDTAVLVVLFPEVSVAIAVRLCWPFANVVVFNDCEYGAALTAAPRFVPSTWNCTLATPTLSLAFAETVTVPVTVAPLAGEVIDTVGGIASPPVLGLFEPTTPAHPVLNTSKPKTQKNKSACEARNAWAPLVVQKLLISAFLKSFFNWNL
jgi:hypothetical protein